MKRMHVHVGVTDLTKSIEYYSKMFDEAPSKVKSDYARWRLNEPQVNFAISTRTDAIGVEHLGIEVESEQALVEVQQQVPGADQVERTNCCYALSDKSWSRDPDGLSWEHFRSISEASDYFGNATADDLQRMSPPSNPCC